MLHLLRHAFQKSSLVKPDDVKLTNPNPHLQSSGRVPTWLAIAKMWFQVVLQTTTSVATEQLEPKRGAPSFAELFNRIPNQVD